MCVCHILWSLTCIALVSVHYTFTSIFVWTSSSGLLLILLLILFSEHRCDYKGCLKTAFFTSCVLGGASLILVATGTCLQYGYCSTKCYVNECCDSMWIPSNITGLSKELNKKLYGQHLAVVPVVKFLRGHVDSQSQKATVLSLNGLPGTGKNFLSRMVAEQMYVKGTNSKYVHFLSATKDFPHENLVEDYKDKLKQIIETSVQECPKSLFIIDEMDKLLPGLIDTIRPYVDITDHIDNIDYRQSLFFFLSNTGGEAIADKVSKVYEQESNREQGSNGEQASERRKLSFKEMEEVVRNSSLNDKNGLFQSSIVNNSLITAYIPFLPLERRHVKQCIIDGLFAKGFYEFEYQVDKDAVEAIAEELLYFPNETQLFSSTGCKRVMEKIDFVMQEEANND